MLSKARIAVFVSGGGTNLQALLDAQRDGLVASGEICLVISSRPGVSALERAAAAGVQTRVVSSRDCSGQADFESKLLEQLKAFSIDLIVLAGFMTILSEDFTRLYPRRIVNVHPALIPSFCGKGMYGLKVHEAALAYGVKVTGATVHFVNEIPDGGEILMQKPVFVKPGDTPEILQRRVMEEAEWQILPRAVELVCQEIIEERKTET